MAAKELLIEKIGRHITGLIDRDEVGDDGRLPSRNDLAELFGVHPTTVTLALRRYSGPHKLITLAGKGVYVQRGAASPRALRLGLAGSFASGMVQGLKDPLGPMYWDPIVTNLVRAATDRGHSVVAMAKPKVGASWLDEIKEAGVDCLITHRLPWTPEEIVEFRRRRIPLILGNCPGRELARVGCSYVDFDCEGEYRSAARKFLELGHRRVACFLSGGIDPTLRNVWREAFILEMVSAGVFYPYDECFMAFPHSEQPGLPSQATAEALAQRVYSSFQSLLDMPEPPTAVFAHMSHNWAKLLAKAAAERGVRLGQDLGLICYSMKGAEDQASCSVLVGDPAAMADAFVSAAETLSGDPDNVVQVDVPSEFRDGGTTPAFNGGAPMGTP